MKGMKLTIKLFTYLSFLGLVVLAMGSKPAPSHEMNVIRIDGSSTVFPIVESASFEYQKKSPQRITVGVSGTGGGFKKFCDGKIDIANASRPIKKEEISKCLENGIKYYEIPIAYDALVIAVNPKNSINHISIDELKKMWQPEAKDQIKNWTQVNPLWENRELKLYGAGTDSGTFDYFTEAVVGKSKSSRPDYTSSEDDNVLVTGVSVDQGALAYFGFAYYEQNKNKLKALSVYNSELGENIVPSPASVMNKTYPLARPLFMYVAESALIERREVREFLVFMMENGGSITEKAKYIPLPSDDYKNNKQKLSQVNTFALIK